MREYESLSGNKCVDMRHGGLGRFRCVCVTVCITLLIWDLTDALSNNEVSTSDIWDHPIGVYLRCCMLGILIRGIIHDKNTTFDIRGIVHAYGDYIIYNIICTCTGY
jgi:hypothetical protein